jgi:imidazoleglycerol-phosphate dehydratase
MARMAKIVRVTSESSVSVELNLDGSGKTDVSTTVPFYDHMLNALGKHALFDLTIEASGDTQIDAHHVVEDTAIVLGQALDQALGDRSGITRFADALVPLDEALAQAVVDVSGRPYFSHEGEPAGFEFHRIGGNFGGSMVSHALESFATNARICLHLKLVSGRDPHHIAEAQFKAVARALRSAMAIDPRVSGVPSTKGTLT